jgi:hypothetical protein
MATQAEKLAALRRAQSPMADVLSHIQYVKGDKGDTGETGTQGPKGDRGAPGKDGRDGVDGKDGKDGQMGLRGFPGENGKDGKDGKNGISPAPIQPQTIIDAVLLELKSGLLQPEHIEGLGENIKSLQDLIKFLKQGGFRGGAGTPVSGGGTAPFAETVSGTINSVNVTFTVPTTIVKAQALYLANSVYQPVVDFTTSGTTITMTVAPDISLAGQPFWLLHT